MSDEVDKIIKDSCSKNCFFTKIKERCLKLIQQKFPSINSKNTLELVEFERTTQAYCQPHKNRKKIYMTLLSKLVYRRCQKQPKNQDECVSYLFEKLLHESKQFDIEQESVVFRELQSKFKELEECYRQTENPKLDQLLSTILLSRTAEIASDANYSKEETIGTINGYLKKIIGYYQKELFDPQSREAFVDNALLHLEDEDMRNYFDHKVFDQRKERRKAKQPLKPLLTMEAELQLFLNQEEISYLLAALLYEFMHKERFFNLINSRIKFRIIDFARRESSSPVDIDLENFNEDNLEESDERLEIDLKRLRERSSSAEWIIFSLKFGTSLTDKIEEVLSHFTQEEILDTAFYAQGVKELSSTVGEKIEALRAVLFDEMKNLNHQILKELQYDKVELKPEIVKKIWSSEPLSYREISLLFGQQPKWANKKKELFQRRVQREKR